LGVEICVKETGRGEENDKEDGETDWELSARNNHFGRSIVEACPKLKQ
jgi:hypothetical protein